MSPKRPVQRLVDARKRVKQDIVRDYEGPSVACAYYKSEVRFKPFKSFNRCAPFKSLQRTKAVPAVPNVKVGKLIPVVRMVTP
jgi:hypothetical protein